MSYKRVTHDNYNNMINHSWKNWGHGRALKNTVSIVLISINEGVIMLLTRHLYEIKHSASHAMGVPHHTHTYTVIFNLLGGLCQLYGYLSHGFLYGLQQVFTEGIFSWRGFCDNVFRLRDSLAFWHEIPTLQHSIFMFLSVREMEHDC